MGLRHNIESIKSLEGVDICWVEEAERVSERSWEILVPTVRKAGSEIWVTFNPAQESDPTYQRFVVNPPPGAIVRKVSWKDNPWLPDVLKAELEHLRRTDPDAYHHVWEGGTWTRSDAQVFNGKWVIDDFEPDHRDVERPVFRSGLGFLDRPDGALENVGPRPSGSTSSTKPTRSAATSWIRPSCSIACQARVRTAFAPTTRVPRRSTTFAVRAFAARLPTSGQAASRTGSPSCAGSRRS